jgi:hypothetical protein
MTTVTLDLDTDLPADRLIAALTDFCDQRPNVFANLDPRFYRVHAVGDTWAEVTEGSAFAGGVWERVRYDWSEPHTVRIQVLDGNAFGRGSSWLYQVEPKPAGAHIHFELRRVPRSPKGRVLAGVLALVGARVFRADLQATLTRLRSMSDAVAA